MDFPAKESHWEGYRQICDYLPTITGFKNVVIIRNEENKGAIRNACDLLDIVHQKYDRYIFSEDDNEFSPNFLDYINAGLNKYKDNPRVVAICGYIDPGYSYNCMKRYPFNAYPIIGYNAWGVGVWFDKKPVFTTMASDKILFSFKTVFKAIRLNQGIAIHRMMYRKRSNATGDLLWRLYCAFNKKYCIFPRISKVRNWGFDGSGSNCAALTFYSKMEIDEDKAFEYDDFEIKVYPEVKKLQKKLYGLSGINLFAFLFEYFLFRITGGTCLRDIKLIRKIMKLKINIKNIRNRR
ncbi:hypothetical protein [Phocaeicola sp.]|uniref:hypothetical protein n=1 Tax=Phocaeicola sp. TaxID=2773926 RepID=UPI003A8D0B94